MAELISSNITGSMDVTGSISLNGEEISAGGGGLSALRGCTEFNASSTFNTSTCGLTSGEWIHVLAVGAGGGGNRRFTGNAGAGGGGAVCSQYYKLTSNSNVSVTIGAGGTGGFTAPTNCNCTGRRGGCTRFGNVCAQGGCGSLGGGKNGAPGYGQSGCGHRGAVGGAFGFGYGGGQGNNANSGGGGNSNGTGATGFVRVTW